MTNLIQNLRREYWEKMTLARRNHIHINEEPNKGKPDFRGLQHETFKEAIARGVPIISYPGPVFADPHKRVAVDFKRQLRTRNLEYWG